MSFSFRNNEHTKQKISYDKKKKQRGGKDELDLSPSVAAYTTQQRATSTDSQFHAASISATRYSVSQQKGTSSPCPAFFTDCWNNCWNRKKRQIECDEEELRISLSGEMQAAPREKRREVETGCITKPTGERKFNYTLSEIRKMSSPVLQKQNFDRHTSVNREGFLLKNKLKKTFGLDTIAEENDAEEEVRKNSLDVVNYILQVRLDELIAMPSRPADGYDEAIITLARKSFRDAPPMSYNNIRSTGRKTSLGGTSSLSSIPSKIAHLKDTRITSSTGQDSNSTRSLLATPLHLLLVLLPTFSEQVLDEVTHDFEYILKYSKYLEDLFSKESITERPKLKKTSFSSERWLAVIYIDYRGSSPIESFRRLLIKLILHKYLIAFEEKDLSREDVLSEFSKRLGCYSPDYDVPFVFTNGVPIGGCSMVYYLYKVGLMDNVFKYSIMDPDTYHRWLHNPIENIVREQLVLRVPLAAFPLVQGVMKGTLKDLDGNTISNEMEAFLVEGAFVVNQAQRKWNDMILNAKYEEPRIIPFVQLKMTIDNVLWMMELALERCRRRRSSISINNCCGLV